MLTILCNYLWNVLVISKWTACWKYLEYLEMFPFAFQCAPCGSKNIWENAKSLIKGRTWDFWVVTVVIFTWAYNTYFWRKCRNWLYYSLLFWLEVHLNLACFKYCLFQFIEATLFLSFYIVIVCECVTSSNQRVFCQAVTNCSLCHRNNQMFLDSDSSNTGICS